MEDQFPEFLERDSWVIVDAFFKKHGITSQQIESFNDFVDNMVPKIIDDTGEIDFEDARTGTRHLFKICSQGFYLKDPTFMEMDALESKLYPNTARLRNITYAAELYAKVRHRLLPTGKVMKEDKIDSKKFRLIGRIPIMVMSKYCRLSKLTSEKDFESIRECPLDPGGYFIVNGKERVILTQERAANNTVFVFSKYTNIKSVLDCEIRSVTEDSSASASAFWVQLREQKIPGQRHSGCKRKLGVSKELFLKAKFPGLSDSLDITVLYQAIGFRTQEEVYESIVGVCSRQGTGDQQESTKKLLPFLLPSLRAWKHMTILEARISIGLLHSHLHVDANGFDYDPAVREERQKEERLKFVENLLLKGLLPHIGVDPSSFRKKGLFLSYMIWKLLMVYTGQMAHDDRDHLQNKRFHCSGPLLAQILHRALCALKQDMERNLMMQIRRDSSVDIDKAITAASVTHMLNYCLSTGNWGNLRQMQSRNGPVYSNVTQELNRYTRNSHLSSLRRLNSPEDKLQLMTKPRQLHNTYFGFICPFETPEGAPIGLVKNLALMAQVTVSSGVKPIIEFLLKLGWIVELEQAAKSKVYTKGLTKLFVEGRWVGFTENPKELVEKFHQGRKSGEVSFYVSICWDPTNRIIEVRSDAGRLCRPLLVVSNNSIVLKRNHLKRLTSGKYKWDDLLRLGLVEIIDVRETESILIAMDMDVLMKNKDKSRTYTHMEIHPALVLGICASTVPFTNHTQSPRIVYQAGISKQAMGVYVTNFLSRMDTSTHFLHYGHRPIVQNKSMKYFKFDEIPAGAVCTVAIGVYTGYNMEDSIILNRSAVQRGLFRSTMFQTYQEKAEKYWESENEEIHEVFAYPSCLIAKGVRIVGGAADIGNKMKLYKSIGQDGLPEPGDKLGYETPQNIKLRNMLSISHEFEVSEEQAIIGKMRRLSVREISVDSARLSGRDTQGLNVVQSNLLYRDISKFIRKPLSSCVDEALITNNALGERLVKVRTRTQIYPQIGDKFSSLHGQKGVVGMDFHEADLPFTKDGIVPDIIMNPHGLPSRMTIGQLYECLYGKAAALEGRIMDGTPFHKRRLEEIMRILHKNGFPQNGTEVMYDGRTGRKLNSAIFIGPTYYQRLKHLVDDKIHSRARGQVDVLTQQPVKGFSREGGLRLGEMERDCLISHGSSLFLMERMMDVSDGKKYGVCGNCGLITWSHPVFHIYGPEGKYNICSSCSQPENNMIRPPPIYTIKMPYAAKLFFQELMCMNILPRIIPSSFAGTNSEEFNLELEVKTKTMVDNVVSEANLKANSTPIPAEP